MAILAAGLCDLGCLRSRNEDRILVDVTRGVFAVADGMGGQQSGHVAAELAVRTIETYVDGADGRSGTDGAVSEHVAEAIKLANRTVWRESQTRKDYEGMGSTLTTVFIHGSTAAIGNIGDSRAYLYRGDSLRALTRDDAVVTNLVEAGKITRDMVRTHPLRNVLTAALGRAEDVSVPIFEMGLEPGDWLMLCSDGLHGVVEDAEMCAAFGEGMEPEKLANKLVEQAKELGGPDNISCIVIAWVS